MNAARAIDRGHLDNRAPAFRIVLHAQPAPRVQATLFAAGDVEPNTEPPCDHPEAGWQKDLFGDCVYSCTFCGAELLEPCEHCTHSASAHTPLTRDGLTICSECRGRYQCHRMRGKEFGE